MDVSVSHQGNICIVTLSGLIDARTTGPLCDTLVAETRKGARHFVVDFARQTSITRAGIRGFVVAAKLLRGVRGEIRICGLTRDVDHFVRGVGFSHLLVLDDDRASALANLGAAPEGTWHYRSAQPMEPANTGATGPRRAAG